MTTENTKKAPSSLISDVTEKELQTLVTKIHCLVGNHDGNTIPAPTFTVSDVENLEKVLNRAQKALVRKVKARGNVADQALRTKVDALLAPALAALVRAHEEYAALSPSLRSVLPTLPEHTAVPLSTIMSAFPAGTAIETAVKQLHGMSYTFVQGRSDKGPRIRVSLPKVETTEEETSEAAE